MSGPSEEEKAAEAAKSAEYAREAKELASAEAVRGKKPVPSEWDGITPEANAWLKANLRDYKTMELIECSEIAEWGEDAWAQRVKYRAQNGFGGMNIEEQLFVIRDGQVINVVEW